jgi:hypothetical protein
MLRAMRTTWIALFFAPLLMACPPEDGEDPSPSPPDLRCSEPDEVPCLDDLLLDLGLHDDKVSEGQVTSAMNGEDVVVVVDATAGGFGQEFNHPFVYLKLYEDRAERVDIDDDTALSSMDWDLALRRFLVRINSGNSGPGCTEVARVAGFDYEDLDSEPNGLNFIEDLYYSGSCEIVPDDSGLPNSPDLAMSGWWSYSSCVQTTLVPYILRLNDGKTLKIVIEAYYATGQETCNSNGSPGSDGGTITLRYRVLGS